MQWVDSFALVPAARTRLLNALALVLFKHTRVTGDPNFEGTAKFRCSFTCAGEHVVQVKILGEGKGLVKTEHKPSIRHQNSLLCQTTRLLPKKLLLTSKYAGPVHPQRQSQDPIQEASCIDGTPYRLEFDPRIISGPGIAKSELGCHGMVYGPGERLARTFRCITARVSATWYWMVFQHGHDAPATLSESSAWIERLAPVGPGIPLASESESA
ncbi:uncharacterized protein EDB91DRAFT_1081067 [Suillus paluster]|uniref:uncharacterized protein n=1 Tax=Suillus paluster TaxID=48578 RepID=UPI001B86CFBE|nr:uncharacterized protein EDB91DRAFT_1081067 [Suillus paluster]KAG1743690.1 hypothetical protein EDB91DRAFT_1081067 [Suillus paluster]